LAWPAVAAAVTLPPAYAELIHAGDFAGLLSLINQQFDIPPLPLAEPPVVYPYVAAHAGAQGTVKLVIYIDEAGVVRDTVVAASPGWLALDDEARRAAAAIRYRPALKDDRPIAAWYIVDIIFYIKPPDEY